MKEQHIHWIEEVTSTNDFVKSKLANSEIAEPYCLATQIQTKGKGRLTNSWESNKGLNVLCSLLADELPISQLPNLMLAAALSVAQIAREQGVNATIKWPNDVMVNDLKLAGILIENIILGNKVKHSIVGVGFNINQTDFKVNATSLKLETGRLFNLDMVLVDLNERFYRLLKLQQSQLLELVNTMLYKKGENVTFCTDLSCNIYQVQAINAQGNLVVLDQPQKEEFELHYHTHKWKK